MGNKREYKGGSMENRFLRSFLLATFCFRLRVKLREKYHYKKPNAYVTRLPELGGRSLERLVKTKEKILIHPEVITDAILQRSN